MSQPLPSLPSTTIPDQVRPEDLPSLLRAIQTQQNRNLLLVQENMNRHPGLSDHRIASGLRAMQGNVSLDKAQLPAPGDPVTAIDRKNARFGASMTNVDVLAQNGNVAAQDLAGANRHVQGLYRVSVVAEVTAGGGALCVLTVTIGWTSNVGAETANPIATLSATGTGSLQNTMVLYSTGVAAITVQTTVGGTAGSLAYNLRVRLERVN